MDVNLALQELIARRQAQTADAPTPATPGAPAPPARPPGTAGQSTRPAMTAPPNARPAMSPAPQAAMPTPPPSRPAPAGAPPPTSGDGTSASVTHASLSALQASDHLPSFVADLIARVPGYYVGTERLKGFAAGLDTIGEVDRARLRDVFETFVTRMVDLGASDLDAGGPAANGLVWYRVGGDKKPRPDVGTYSKDETDMLFLNTLNDKQRKVLWEENSIDFSYELEFLGTDGRPRRFRATCYYDYDHLALNMRSITSEVRPIKSLEFHPLIEKGLMFRHERDGLTLVTGVTGSGKSSTLDAIIDANNEDVHAHIVIVGKPVEYMHRSKNCIVRHREVGKDVPTFKEGIVQALRQDPDMVVIGEMRDPETISSGLEITDSGHKVFSTLHTSSAVESIDRIIGEYPHEEQERIRNRLADVLRCIVSQKLAPRLGGGRVLCKEVLWMTSAARAAIKNKNAGEIYQMMWEGNAQGQITMEQDLYRLVRQRLISPETAFSYANNKKRLQQLMG